MGEIEDRTNTGLPNQREGVCEGAEQIRAVMTDTAHETPRVALAAADTGSAARTAGAETTRYVGEEVGEPEEPAVYELADMEWIMSAAGRGDGF